MAGGERSSQDTPVNHEKSQQNTPLQNPEHLSNIARRMSDNKNSSEVSGNNQEMNQHGNGNSNEFALSPQNYFDSNWASSLLMDPNNDILYNMDFEAQENASAANTQVYPISQSSGNPNLNIKPHISLPAAGRSQIPNPNLPPAPQGLQSYIQAAQQQLSQHPKKGSKQRRPCDHCRRRKTKCVIIPNTNNCAQCESKSLTCTYVGLALKRKTGYDSDSDSKRMKAATDSNNEKDLTSAHSNQLPIGGARIVPPNVPIRDVAPVQDYSSINNSLLRKTLSLQFPRSSFYVGPTSYLFDTNLLNLIIDSQNNAFNANISGHDNANGSGKIEQVNLNDSTSLRKVSDNAQFILKDDQSSQTYVNMSNDVDIVEKFVAPHGQILIDLYFRIIHPSYPVLHKKVFLEKYSRTHREFSAPLLAAVYALAIQWWDYDPQLNRFPKPNVDSILKIGLNNYLLEILKRPKLSAVQAGLLLLQCKHIIQNSSSPNSNTPNEANTNTSTGDSSYSDWVLCSQVITLAEELGLGLDCNNWKLPKWERGLRKRLAWAVYMEDKWLSLKNSRPSHINEINWVVHSLVDEDFPEKHGDGDLKEGSSDIDNGKKIFMNLINLTTILSDILNQLYSMKAMTEVKDINQVLQIAKPLQLRLRNWYHSLPVDLQMNNVQPRKLCSNGYLQLAYFATELTLHRRIVTTIFLQSLAGNPPPKELVDVCRTAAKTRLTASIEFVRDLKPEHMHSFWHSSSPSNFTLICTFAAILYMTSSNKEESDFYKDQIFNYRWILKISSKGFDRICDVLLELDIVMNHIPGLLNEKDDLPIIPSNQVPYDQRQLQQQLPHSKGMQSSFGVTSQRFNGPPPLEFSNQIIDKNNSSNRSSLDLNRQGEWSQYNSPMQYSNQDQNYSARDPPRQKSQDISPKEIIKHQGHVGSNIADSKLREVSSKSPVNNTPNSDNTQKGGALNPTASDLEVRSDKDEMRS